MIQIIQTVDVNFSGASFQQKCSALHLSGGEKLVDEFGLQTGT